MAGGPIAVLIIEDEPAIRRFLRVSLVESGYRVIEPVGREAMRRLCFDRPDIIILDLPSRRRWPGHHPRGPTNVTGADRRPHEPRR